MSNANLVNAKVDATAITAQSIVVSDERGLAYFNDKGMLLGSTAVQFNKDGKVEIKDLSGDLNVHGHAILNSKLMNVTVASSPSITTSSLVLRDLRSNAGGSGGVSSLLHVDEQTGKVCSVPPSLMSIHSGGEYLSVGNLHVSKITGIIDAAESTLQQPKLEGGMATGLSKISTAELQVHLIFLLSIYLSIYLSI